MVDGTELGTEVQAQVVEAVALLRQVLGELQGITAACSHLTQEMGGMKSRLDSGFSELARRAVETQVAALGKRGL